MNAPAQPGEVWAKDKQSVVMVQNPQGTDRFYLVPFNTQGQLPITREQLNERLQGYQKIGEFVVGEVP